MDASFIETYITQMMEQAKSSGLTGKALKQKVEQAENRRQQYGNPLHRIPMTFLEIFPVGLLFSLIAALVFKK